VRSVRNRTLMLVYVNTLVGRYARRQMPLGLQFISAAARKAGWDVLGRYWGGELTAASFQADLDRTAPDAVGFYTDMVNVHTLGRLLHRVRTAGGPVTILGGPEATFDARTVMERCPADLLVRGDGEPAIAELLRGNLRDPELLAHVAGLSYRQDGAVRHNADRARGAPDLEADGDGDLLPDRRLAPAESSVLHLLTARGCPNRCAFCSEATLPYRPRKLEIVRQELAEALAQGRPDWAIILDDTFSTVPARAAAIGTFLRDLYGGPWSCEVAASDICRRPELASQLVEAGLRRVQIGIESANDPTLRVYGKKITSRSLKRAIDILFDAGAWAVYGNLIVGAPGETAAMVRANMEFAEDLIRRYPGRIELSVSILAHNPGAPFFESPEAFGLRFAPEDLLGTLDFRSAACGTSSLSRQQIQELYEEFCWRIAQAVEATLKELTPDQIRQQLSYNEVGFSTPWNKRLLAVQHIAKHYQYVKYEGSHLDVGVLSDAELEGAIPQRTRLEVQLGLDGNVVLTGLSGKVRQLNATGSFLDEIACGELSVRQIAELLHSRLPPTGRPSFERILSDTVAFYRCLAEEMYVAFVIP
jgi:radical SAM superfamily enzyme YgiQ (UPF0313 family)